MPDAYPFMFEAVEFIRATTPGNLSDAQIAAMGKVYRGTLHRWVTKDRSPRRALLLRFALACGVDPQVLERIARTGEMPTEPQLPAMGDVIITRDGRWGRVVEWYPFHRGR
jgi:hypothetical protein